MKTFAMPGRFCLRCGYSVDAASNLFGKGRPDPGDVTICLSCGGLLQFTEGDNLQPYNGTLDDLNPRQRQMVDFARRFIRARGPLSQGTRH